MKRIHFVAIGGSAMHNLALALIEKGYQVTGSDDIIFEPSKTRLKNRGLLPETFGWFPEKITSEIDEIILGMHAHDDNPELKKAKELGLKIFSYPEYLYHQSKDKNRVVIAGSHGKTTITSMVLHVLNDCKKEIDFMVGAQLKGFDIMVKLTHQNNTIILEGDEYLSSTLDKRPKFLHYKPNVALISGISWDHINVFPTFEIYLTQFKLFIDSIEDGGTLIYNELDQELVKLVKSCKKQIKKIAYSTPVHQIKEEETFLVVDTKNIPLKFFGNHNLNNLEGARVVCNELGIANEDFYTAIQSFTGASKRLERINNNPIVFKDFAHAPSKVISTTIAVKNQYKSKIIVACLELHTYSSLNKEFLNEYRNSLNKADIKIVFYSKEALEIKRMEVISPNFIKECFNTNDLEVYTNTLELENRIKGIETNNTVFLFMSSGNYGGLDLAELF
ncbi:MAG: UDP-N-acetylmuramate--L-alanine ligase [Solirubrobacteraceae bacterium]